MRKLICSLALSVGVVASGPQAQSAIDVDGTKIDLPTLLENCKSLASAPEAQLACFNALSELLKNQEVVAEPQAPSVADALAALRDVAQYRDDETGLSIAGNDCKIHVVYFNNYYHLSRRNVSTIDLFSAEFDASKLQYDKVVQDQGAQAPLSKAVMEDGATATVHGGLALDSTAHGFTPRSARMSLDVYAGEVVTQLPPTDAQTFDFVLVHPKRDAESGDIWTAFDAFVSACQG